MSEEVCTAADGTNGCKTTQLLRLPSNILYTCHQRILSYAPSNVNMMYSV